MYPATIWMQPHKWRVIQTGYKLLHRESKIRFARKGGELRDGKCEEERQRMKMKNMRMNEKK
jgi:hypothetical protein